MRIILVSSVFPPGIGGPSGQTYHLARLLVKQGHDLVVATTQPEPEQLDGLMVHCLKLPRFQLLNKLGLIIGYLSVLIQLRNLVREFKPDVIHCQTGITPLSIVTGLVARLMGVPSLVKFSGDMVWERYSKHSSDTDYEELFFYSRGLEVKFLKSMAALGFSLYDTIWSTSKFQTRVLMEGYRIEPVKIFQCPNLSYLEPFRQVAVARLSQHSPDYISTILVVSRFVPWKHIDDSIRTFALVRRKIKAVLRIVGAGSDNDMDQLRDLAAGLGLILDKDIIFDGIASPTRIAEYYRDADVFLSNTTYEPFGIVFVEAIASGLKVVAPRVGGIPDVLENVPYAYLYPSKDIQKASEYVIAALFNQRSEGFSTDEFTQMFEITKQLNILVDLYSSLILQRQSCQF